MSVSPPLQQVGRTHVRWRGRKLSYFGGCDYFRLASHPQVLAAIRRGLQKYGLNVSASRLTTGNHRLYEELERELARFFGAETATLGPNGYAPNLMAAQALAGQFSHALIDERAHGCLLDAAHLLDCPVVKFKHRAPHDLGRLLHRLGRIKPIVLTDGLFAHDGTVAPLVEYLAVLPAGGMLLVDDAHGAGVLGKTGRGTMEAAGVSSRRIIQTITLSKAFGVYGGAVLGTRQLKTAILARSRAFVGSTPLPLPLAYAALKALGIVKRGQRQRSRLDRNVVYLRQKLQRHGVPVPDVPGPIVTVVPGKAKDAARLQRRLLDAGIHPPFINYPGGSENGYFRFAISSEHSRGQLDALASVMVATLCS